jgi:hypothetical protein
MPEIAELHVVLLDHGAGGCSIAVYMSTGTYRPYLRLRADGEYLGVAFHSGTMISPRVEANVSATLLYPGGDYSSVVPGARFEIIEGSTIIGYATVLRRDFRQLPKHPR